MPPERVRRFDAATGEGGVKERRQLALMLAPYTLGALLLFIAPAAYSLALSLTDADLLTPARFVGLAQLPRARRRRDLRRRALALGAVRADRGAAAAR